MASKIESQKAIQLKRGKLFLEEARESASGSLLGGTLLHWKAALPLGNDSCSMRSLFAVQTHSCITACHGVMC